MATQTDFKALVPDPASTLCAVLKKWVKLPLTIYNWIIKVTDSEGRILGALPLGSYRFSSTPLVETELWRLANGQELAIASYPALWDAYNHEHKYGAPSNEFSFKLPDLRCRFPIMVGTLPSGKVIDLGTVDGEEQHVLTVAELPKVTLTPKIGKEQMVGYQADGGGFISSCQSNQTSADNRPVDIPLPDTKFGGDSAHNNMPPYLGVFVYVRTK